MGHYQSPSPTFLILQMRKAGLIDKSNLFKGKKCLALGIEPRLLTISKISATSRMRDTHLGQLKQHVTLALGFVSLSPTLGTELT